MVFVTGRRLSLLLWGTLLVFAVESWETAINTTISGQHLAQDRKQNESAPTTALPTTVAPTTVAPTAGVPAIVLSTTVAPTAGVPTAGVPTTVAPTAGVPTAGVPTTVAPTAGLPTTVAQTTNAPTTAPHTTTPKTDYGPDLPSTTVIQNTSGADMSVVATSARSTVSSPVEIHASNSSHGDSVGSSVVAYTANTTEVTMTTAAIRSEGPQGNISAEHSPATTDPATTPLTPTTAEPAGIATEESPGPTSSSTATNPGSTARLSAVATSTVHNVTSSSTSANNTAVSIATNNTTPVSTELEHNGTSGPVPATDLTTAVSTATMSDALTNTTSPSPSQTSTPVVSRTTTVVSKAPSTPEPTWGSSSTASVDVSTPPLLSTTNPTNSSVVLAVNRKPKRLPETTTRGTTPHHARGPTAGPRLEPFCPSTHQGMVSRCLIAIASLAALATVFMVTTIVLCTKASSRKYRYRVQEAQQGSEVVCISELLPERGGGCGGSGGRHNKANRNGALMPMLDMESDDDNLTLHSFLPENLV